MPLHMSGAVDSKNELSILKLPLEHSFLLSAGYTLFAESEDPGSTQQEGKSRVLGLVT